MDGIALWVPSFISEQKTQKGGLEEWLTGRRSYSTGKYTIRPHGLVLRK